MRDRIGRSTRRSHLGSVTRTPRLASVSPREVFFDWFVELLVQFEVEKTQKATAAE